MLKPDRFSCSQKIQLKRDPLVYVVYSQSLLEACTQICSQSHHSVIFIKANKITTPKVKYPWAMDLP